MDVGVVVVVVGISVVEGSGYVSSWLASTGSSTSKGQMSGYHGVT